MTYDKKPMEFYIHECVPLLGENYYHAYVDKPNNRHVHEKTKIIHVIEYSAYESLQAELADIRAENDLLKTQYQPLVVANKEMRVIVETLEAKAQKLVEALECSHNVFKKLTDRRHRMDGDECSSLANETLSELTKIMGDGK